MLEQVKTALRISHNRLDEDIENTIAEAKEELERMDIDTSIESNLVNAAVKTYCLYAYADDTKRAEGYLKSFQYQADNLRKSIGYTKAGE